MNDLSDYTLKTAKRAKQASRALAVASGAQKTDWLRKSAAMICESTAELIESNHRDLKKAPEYG